jgi:hypothetical protein
MSGPVGDNVARASGVIASAGGGGEVLQVVSYATASTAGRAAATQYYDIPSFLVAITPAATDSRIWVQVSIGMWGQTSGGQNLYAVERAISGGATELLPTVGTASGNRLGGHGRQYCDSADYGSAMNFSVLDTTHNTTSEITYQLQWNPQGTSYLNRSGNDGNTAEAYGGRTASNMTAWEIGA